MTHGEAAHERGTHNMFTGYRPSPAITFPSMGSVVSHELGVRNNLPPYVAVPNVVSNFAQSGYLSSSFAPFSLGSDPANGGFKVQDLALPGDVPPQRFTTRQDLLESVNEHFKKKEKADNLDAMDTFYQRAYGLISSEKARAAFDINQEKPQLRDEYGRNAAGQRFLMARRLVEAGVGCVTLSYGGWDTHGGNFRTLRKQLPELDRGLANMIQDLHDRGMEQDVVTVMWGEFGRTPKVNNSDGGGRDHWSPVMSALVAGGGLKMGQAIGTSTARGELPRDRRCTVPQVLATIYHAMGIDPAMTFPNGAGRPMYLLEDRQLISELV
jgi:hypothetical protein